MEIRRKGGKMIPRAKRKKGKQYDKRDYKKVAEANRLCLAIMVQTLKALKVRKTRIKMILYEIRYDFLNYEIWSVFKDVADKTGCDVREVF